MTIEIFSEIMYNNIVIVHEEKKSNWVVLEYMYD